jgi:hypothetical protein
MLVGVRASPNLYSRDVGVQSGSVKIIPVRLVTWSHVT